MRWLPVTLVLVVCSASHALAQERILSFDSTLTIETDGSVTVTDVIVIQDGADALMHGFSRDFRLTQVADAGIYSHTQLEIISVLMDGNPVPFSLEKTELGWRLKAREDGNYLMSGDYAFTITYRLWNQVAFRGESNSLVWDVTGFDWPIPIGEANARIQLPAGAEVTEAAAAFGPADDMLTIPTALPQQGVITVARERVLVPRAGLTLAVAWPQGFVAEPRVIERAPWLAPRESGFLIILLGLLASSAYYFGVWHKMGRDPESETVIPRFSPPERLSPLAAGFLWHRGFEGRFSVEQAFSVALVSLATKHAIKLEEQDDGFLLTQRERPRMRLSRAEKVLMRHLFQGGAQCILLKRAYDYRIDLALGHFVSAVRSNHHEVFWRDNVKPWSVGVAILLASIFLAWLADKNIEGIISAGFILAVFGIGMVGMLYRFGIPAHKVPNNLIRGERVTMLLLPLATIVVLVLGYGMVAGLVEDVPGPALIVAAAGLVQASLFFWLIKAPTVAGSKLMSRIEGYRLYLSAAESLPLEAQSHEPELNAQLFELHLPYAMALGVADTWEHRFEGLTPDGESTDHPAAWYHGALISKGLDGSSLAMERSLVETVVTAAHPPTIIQGPRNQSRSHLVKTEMGASMAHKPRHWGKRMMILVYLSVPFLLVAGVFFLMSQRATGWDAMGHGIGVGFALMAWGVVIIGFLIWLVIRDGLVASNIIPLIILGALVGAAAWWGANLWSDHRTCARDSAFFEAYALADMAGRKTMLDEKPERLAATTRCGDEALDLDLGYDMFDPPVRDDPVELDRLAAWQLLLDRGLPVTRDRLFGTVNDADAGLMAMLVARRVADGEAEPVSAELAAWTIQQIDMDPDSPYNQQAPAYLAMLATYRDAGLDLCQAPNTNGTLILQMQRKDVPEEFWKDAACS